MKNFNINFISILLLIFILNSCEKKDDLSQRIDQNSPDNDTEMIYNGYPVSIVSNPYQAAIFVNGNFMGGGVVLNENWILTAGHVITVGGGYSGNVQQTALIEVGTGSTQLSNTNRVGISQIIRHPNYSINHDIALIQLSTPLQSSDVVSAIDFADANYLQFITNDKSAWVSGWGSRENFQYPNDLYKANVVITNNSQSQSVIYTTSANPSSQQGPCYGDSGGPLVISGPNNLPVLVGIVNGWGDCATGIKGYARVSYYAEWIQQITGIQTPPPMSISGADYICAFGGETGVYSYTYSISNLPPNATISWSVNPSANLVIDGANNLPEVDIVLVDNIPNITLSATITIGNRNIIILKEIGAGYPENLDFHSFGSGTMNDPLYITLVSSGHCLNPWNVIDIEWDYYTDNGLPVNLINATNPYTCGGISKDGIVIGVNIPLGINTNLTVRARAKNQCGWSPWVYLTKNL